MYIINLNPTRPGVSEWRDLGSSTNNHGVFIPEGGIEGFSSSPSAVATSSTAVPGQTVHGMDYPPIEGTLSLKILPDSEYITSVSRIYSDLVDSFHPLYETAMEVVKVDGSLRTPRFMRVRLSSPIEAPASSGHQLNNSGGSDRQEYTQSLDVSLNLVGDSGYWTGSLVQGDGTIMNSGDLNIYAQLGVQIGASGEVNVTSPSGSTVRLEATPGSHLSINLDPQNYYVIENGDSGRIDRWDLLPEVTVLSEAIPPWNENYSSGLPSYSVSGAGSSLTAQFSPRYLSPWS